PWFIRLLATENIQRAEFVKKITDIKALHSPIVEQIRTVLAAGQKAKLFRRGVDPIHLYISIAGGSYFFFSNIHTLSVIFRSEDTHRAGSRAEGKTLQARRRSDPPLHLDRRGQLLLLLQHSHFVGHL